MERRELSVENCQLRVHFLKLFFQSYCLKLSTQTRELSLWVNGHRCLAERYGPLKSLAESGPQVSDGRGLDDAYPG